MRWKKWGENIICGCLIEKIGEGARRGKNLVELGSFLLSTPTYRVCLKTVYFAEN